MPASDATGLIEKANSAQVTLQGDAVLWADSPQVQSSGAGKLRFEALTLPTAANPCEKRIFSIPAAPGAEGRKELSAWSDCVLPVPDSWEGLSTLVTAPLIRVYDGDTWITDFVAERRSRNLRQPTLLDISGPELAGWGPARILVYPPDYGTNPSKRPNWKWGMENLIDLELTGLGNTSEEWTLYLSGERYELDSSLATAGTYTLTVGGNTTAAIDFDAEASTVKSELEGLAGVTTVTVTQPDPDVGEYFVVFENPKDLGSDMTITDSTSGGGVVLTKLNDGFDTGTSPTFSITVDGQTTSALAWNASANTVEGSATGGTGLQGLSNVSDVAVSGSGLFDDPWIITFFNPADIDSFSVTFAAGTAVATRTVAGGYSTDPVTISKPIDEGTGPEEVHGAYRNPPLEVNTDIVDTGADYSIQVNANGIFAGSQLVLNVEPGEIYQASISLQPAANGLYVLVIHDENQNQLARTADTLLTAGSFQELSLSDILIPDGVERVIMREAVVSVTGSTANQYVNWQGAKFMTGLAESTPGDFVGTILAHGQAQGDGTWLDFSAGAVNDTDGTPFPETYSYQADGFAMNLSHVLEDMRDLGYEWTITPKSTPSGGLTHDLNLWVPEGAGTDRTTTGPVLMTGGAIVDGQVVDRIPDFTVGVAWGADDLYLEDENATTRATYGRLTRMLDVEYHGSEPSLQDVLDTAFADEATNRQAGSVKLRGSGSVIPFVHFGLGDLLVWQAGDRMAKNNRRVQTITWKHGDPVAEYEVQGSRVWGDPMAAIAEGLRRLMDAPKKRKRSKNVRNIDRAAAGGDVVGAYIHLERATAQSIPSGTTTAISWDTSGHFPPRNFAIPALPSSQVTIQEPGYYDVHVGLKLASSVDSPSVHITLTRAGSEQTIWPMSSDPSIWTADYETDRFSETGKGIPFLSGDIVQAYVTQSSGSAVNLTAGVLAVELVDRVSAPTTGARIMSAAYTEAGPLATHPVTLPGSFTGDLLIVGVSTAAATSITFPAGWTDLGSESVASRLSSKWAFKVADGTEGTSVDVTLGSSTFAFGHSVVITGDTEWGTPDVNTLGESISDSASPPSTAQPPTVSVSSAGRYLVFVSCLFRDIWELSGPAGWDQLEQFDFISGGHPESGTLLSFAELFVSTSVAPGIITQGTWDANGRGRTFATIAVKVEE